MKKKKYIKVAKEVIDLEIKALTKLKNNINDSFNLAVNQILVSVKSNFMGRKVV